MAGVPYTFATATTSIPLSQLDANFNTTLTLGNTSVGLGNTVTTIGNLTLTNVTIASGTNNVSANSIANGTSNVVIASSGGAINIATNGTTAVTIDTSQNVGVGVTPSSWNTYTNNIETPTGAVVSYSPSSNLGIVQNAYYNSGWKYKTSNYASFYLQSSGVHSWSYASSGTAGNAVTFNEAMRIDPSGNFMISTTGALGKATVAGTGYYGNGINGNSTGTSGGAYFYQAGWDSSGTTHTISYGSSTGYTQYDNAAGFLIVSASNKSNSGKAGAILIAWAKARSDGIYITTVSTQKSTNLSTLSASTSGNNIVITTDSDCYITFNVLGGV